MIVDSIDIRRLVQADSVLYRGIRLEALQGSPEAFGSSFEFETGQPLSWFADRLAGSTVLGAFHGGQLVGTAGFAIQQGPKRAHKGLLWGMYVRPDARKASVGRRLVEAVCDLAGQQVELIQLTVVRDNVQARSLYAKMGFLEYGLETNALKHHDRYYDEYLLAKNLSEKPQRDV